MRGPRGAQQRAQGRRRAAGGRWGCMKTPRLIPIMTPRRGRGRPAVTLCSEVSEVDWWRLGMARHVRATAKTLRACELRPCPQGPAAMRPPAAMPVTGLPKPAEPLPMQRIFPTPQVLIHPAIQPTTKEACTCTYGTHPHPHTHAPPLVRATHLGLLPARTSSVRPRSST